LPVGPSLSQASQVALLNPDNQQCCRKTAFSGGAEKLRKIFALSISVCIAF
jgi:hypothetical protein